MSRTKKIFGLLVLGTILLCLVLATTRHIYRSEIDSSANRITFLEVFYISLVCVVIYVIRMSLEGYWSISPKSYFVGCGFGAVLVSVLPRIIAFSETFWHCLAAGSEILSFPGRQLLSLLGRPRDLVHDHFSPGFEIGQFMYFIPLNTVAWIALAEIAVGMWSWIRTRSSAISAALFFASFSALVMSLLATFGNEDLEILVDLLVFLAGKIAAVFTFGLVSVDGAGLLSGVVYWFPALVFLYFSFRLRARGMQVVARKNSTGPGS
jgi:hypothetical protein